MDNNLRVTDHRTGRAWYCNHINLMHIIAQIRTGDSFTIEHVRSQNNYGGIHHLLARASQALALGHAEDADVLALASDAEGWLLEALEMWPTEGGG